MLIAGKEVAAALVRLTAVPLLIREWVQRRAVTILVYHRLDPGVADRHFRFLSSAYTPIPLQDYLTARRRGTVASLPPKSLVVTIDDGHRSTALLKEVAARHHVPLTVFLCTGLVGTGKRFWFLHSALTPPLRETLKRMPEIAAKLAAT